MNSILKVLLACMATMMLVNTASACSTASARAESLDYELLKSDSYCSVIISSFSSYKEAMLCPLSRYEVKNTEIELTSAQCDDLESGKLKARIVKYKGQLFLD